MNDIITKKIKIWGNVAGPEFLQFVSRTAARLAMKGEVLHEGGLVHIIVSDTEKRTDAFIDALKKDCPTETEVTYITKETVQYRHFEGFAVSDEGDAYEAYLRPDKGFCSECCSEMLDSANSRYMYPFITCSNCGPRYSVADRLPFTRENTSMKDFPMCRLCALQYRAADDRRNNDVLAACHNCGPRLGMRLSKNASVITSEAFIRWKKNPDDREKMLDDGVWSVIYTARNLLAQGRVIAVKGMGGYSFFCDSANEMAVSRLRTIKQSDRKYFAVMFKNMDWVGQYCRVGIAEGKLLKSAARPVVLLEKQPHDFGHDPFETDENLQRKPIKEFDSSRFIAAVLPGTGLEYMLLDIFKRPLLVSSANVTGMPVIYDDEEMFAMLETEKLLAGVFYGEDRIRTGLDDSIVRIIDNRPQIIRRSKGYAPAPLYIRAGGEASERLSGADGKAALEIFATGGQVNSAFVLARGKTAYQSQYMGSLFGADNRRVYTSNVARMKKLLGINPKYVACDMHPLYFSTSFAANYMKMNPDAAVMVPVQHHHAHIASVMAEHGLDGPVIGVSFDGAGYGTDENVWGGEIMLCRGGHFKRLSHLKYVNMIRRDFSPKEAWKTAMCYLHDMDNGGRFSAMPFSGGSGPKEAEPDESREFSVNIGYLAENTDLRKRPEWVHVRDVLDSRAHVIKSSSVGRLFDAAAALIGISGYNEYGGQCAILLEEAAARAMASPGADKKDDLALLFHRQIANTVLSQCREVREGKAVNGEGKDVNTVVLSGGVFENRVLTELTLSLLRKDSFDVYYNISVGPNDGCIALGQTYVIMKRIAEGEI
ncbi:MAG: Sua5/YciO/YrdC/YwlC family protein [Clostridia bacterium]|nr:Sua5/YciO/YrdC/YwlC family protein [Clostridia bacterium]